MLAMRINTFFLILVSLIFFRDIQAGVQQGGGPFIACNTHYENKLIITTPKSYLDQVQATNIDIVERRDTPIIYLGNHTRVTGVINFTENEGLVILDSTAKLKGSVTNGLIATKDFQSLCKGG
jgi:hypothetical protein